VHLAGLNLDKSLGLDLKALCGNAEKKNKPHNNTCDGRETAIGLMGNGVIVGILDINSNRIQNYLPC